jgi:hypothetical protein
MIKHVWSVLAQSSVIDGRTNVLSIQNVLESLQVGVPVVDLPKEIVAPINANLISFFTRDSASVENRAMMHVSFVSPEGDSLMKLDSEVLAPKGKRNTRIIAQIHGLPLRGNGLYHFEISLDNELVESLPLEVAVSATVEP